jgi:PAS domain S-box-containing protein
MEFIFPYSRPKMKANLLQPLASLRMQNILSAVILLISLAAMAGWRWGFPYWQDIKFNSALGLALTSLALILWSPRTREKFQWLRSILGALILILGACTGSQYLFEKDWGIDQLFVLDLQSSSYPGRPSPASALVLTLTGLSLIFREHQRVPIWLLPSSLLSLVAIGALVHMGSQQGLYSEATEALWILSLGAVVLAIMVWILVRVLNESDLRLVKKSRESELELRALNTTLENRIFERTRELELSEGRYRTLVENAYDSILVADRQGQILMVNTQLQKQFGYSGQELVGQQIEILLPEQLRNRHMNHRKSYNEQAQARPMGTGLELFGRRKDGTEFPVDISLCPLNTVEGSRITAVIRDVTERKKIENENSRLFQEAKTAVKDREFILSLVSHDLKNSLSTVELAARMLGEPGLSKDQISDLSQRLLNSSAMMQRLISDLLDFGKANSGHLSVRKLPVAVEAVIEAALESLSPRALAKSLKIELEVQESLPLLLGDSERLIQVLWNLLGNAIKFTPNGGEIKIGAHLEEARVHFCVSDSGPGISEADQKSIFEKFWQVQKASSLGTGLGLAIAKDIVEVHGGVIWVTSCLNQGSHFHFCIPVCPVETKSQPSDRRPPTVSEFAGRTILVVDDSKDNLQLNTFWLRKMGSHVLAASSVREALHLIEVQVPDLILTDIEMPEQTGYDLLQAVRIRELQWGHAVPIVALTGHSGLEEIEKILQAGFESCLTKPVSREKLGKTLQGFMNF